MNKRLFGIKIGTLLTIAACLIVSLAIWLLVEHNGSKSPETSEECMLAVGFDYL